MFYSKISLVVLAVVVIFLSRAAYGAYQKYALARATLKSAETKLAEIESRQETIRTEINELKTTRGIESELRTKFQVAKPGEEVIIIVEPKGTTSTSNRQ